MSMLTNIIKESRPESGIKGHRIHVTLRGSGERWPEWGKHICGTGFGMVHFENEGDFKKWYAIHADEFKVAPSNEVAKDDSKGCHGRCVPECGPIGFMERGVAA